MSTEHRKTIILGSGPAGLSAAIYTARAGLKPLLIHGMQPGGQLTITTDVENYPGFADVIQGPWLMEQMEKQAAHVGTDFEHDLIESVDLQKRPFTLKGDSGKVYTCDTLIICTGAQAKWLGIPSETEYQGFGVSACATCDGTFFRNQVVYVVGGGNTAVEEGLYLSHIAKEVHIVHRRDHFRAEKILQERLFKKSNITVHWNSAIEEITGESDPFKKVTGVRLKNTETGEVTAHPADGVFIAIGHAPNTGLFKGQLKMDDHGYLITKPDSTQTDIKGVFAAGDVQDSVYRQAVTAAGTGCMAALEAERLLAVEE